MLFPRSVKVGFLCFGAALLLAGCSWLNKPMNSPDAQPRAEDAHRINGPQDATQHNEDLLSLVAKSTKNANSTNNTGAPAIGVNSYLWHASLDTISFMPLASADPFGGVIITDWYSPPQTPDERFKINIFILNRQLRADGVRCSVFRQKRDAKGDWVDAPVDKNTPIDLENAILARARQMLLSTASIQQ